MLATCSNILQIWNNENYSQIQQFGQDHLPANDTIKSIDWKKDNCLFICLKRKRISFDSF